MKGEGTTREPAQSRNFTPAQVAALRAELVKHVRRTTYNEVANTLGIHPQHVWKIVARRKSCSYFTASRIAQLAGYRGVDAFFEAKGIALPRIVPLPKRKPKLPPKTDASEFAVRLRAVLGRVRDNFGGRDESSNCRRHGSRRSCAADQVPSISAQWWRSARICSRRTRRAWSTRSSGSCRLRAALRAVDRVIWQVATMPSERTTPQTRNFWPAQIDVLRAELAKYAKVGVLYGTGHIPRDETPQNEESAATTTSATA